MSLVSSVSVIIPCYNGEATIRDAIDSVLCQEYDNFEVVVVNDGSTDNTAEIVKRYSSQIKLIGQSNRGPAAARNAGARVARGEYLAFLDADDEWLPQKLCLTVSALERNPDAVMAYSALFTIGSDGRAIEKPGISPTPLPREFFGEDWFILPSTAVIRRGVFELCGGFCEEFERPGFEDPYMWLIARERGPFTYVPEPLVRYRSPDPAKVASKYEQGRKLFSKLLVQRYGKRARPLVRWFNRHHAVCLIASAIRKLDDGDLRGGVSDLCASMVVSPQHTLSIGVVRRLLRPAAFRRLAKAVLGSRPSAQSV